MELSVTYNFRSVKPVVELTNRFLPHFTDGRGYAGVTDVEGPTPKYCPFETDYHCLLFIADYLRALPDDEDLMILSPRKDPLSVIAGYLKDQDICSDLLKKLRLLTCHKAKGLESTHVIIVAFHDGFIPHYDEIDTNNSVALAYVAVSRAKKYLTVCTWDASLGSLSGKEFSPSPFLKIMDLETVSPEFILEENFDV